MITLNGKRFGRNNAEVVASLFTAGGTCGGTYKVTSTRIILKDLSGNVIGGINRHGVLHASTKCSNGKLWHSYADVEEIGRYASYRNSVEEPRKVLAECLAAHGVTA